MRIADRVNKLAGEGAFDVLSRVRALEARGRSIVSFAIGEPDFDTENRVKEAAVEALRRGETHYTPSEGSRKFRESVARHVSRTRDIEVDPGEVVCTPGVKPILFYAIMTCVEAGDEVIVPSPGFPAYESLVAYAGGIPVRLPLREELDFAFDIDELRRLVTSKTKMIIINSPQNPTGGVLGRQELEAVARISAERDIWVLTDEVYSSMVYDGGYESYLSVPGAKERAILVDGFSKTWAMTGWRLGFSVMNRELAPHFTRLLTNNVSCTAAFSQAAGIEALEGSQDYVQEMTESYRNRRDLLVEGLQSLPGFLCREPKGAFYVYANVTGLCREKGLSGAEELQTKLLDEAGVAVLSRTCFGQRFEGESDEYVRFCYATSDDQIREGLERLRRFVGSR